MAKFAEKYADAEFVQTVSAQIPWSHNVFNKSKREGSQSKSATLSKF